MLLRKSLTSHNIYALGRYYQGLLFCPFAVGWEFTPAATAQNKNGGSRLLPYEKRRKKKMKNTTTKKPDVKKITMIAMLTAIGVVLQYLEISIPLVPSFIKLDFADLPELVGAFFCGPASGVLICLLRNVIHMLVSQSGFIGELSNFILGAFFALTAGLIYKKMPDFKGMLIGGIAGAIVMGIVSLPSNYFLIYPLYYNVMGLPEPAILEAYQLIRPSTKNIAEALLIFNVPFTVIKALISVTMSAVIYKPLNTVLSKIK